jgi:hypothetical protein
LYGSKQEGTRGPIVSPGIGGVSGAWERVLHWFKGEF